MVMATCDRCKKTFEYKMGYSAQIDYRLFHNGSLRQVGGYDFCPECMKDFKNWAHGWEEKQTGWISVKDRLPEEDVPVLVCYIGAEDSIKEGQDCTDGIANYHNGSWCWWVAYGDCNNEQLQVIVTHWMPLPEPPGDSDAQD